MKTWWLIRVASVLFDQTRRLDITDAQVTLAIGSGSFSDTAVIGLREEAQVTLDNIDVSKA